MNKFIKLSICIIIIFSLLLSLFIFFEKYKKNNNENDNKKSVLVLNFQDSLKENDFKIIHNTLLAEKKEYKNKNFSPKLDSSIKLVTPNYLITINDDLTFSYNVFNKDMIYVKVLLDNLSNTNFSLSSSQLNKSEEFFIYNFIGNIITKDFSNILSNNFLYKDYLNNNLNDTKINLNNLYHYIKNNFGLLKLELSNEDNLNKIKTFNLINIKDRDTLLEIETIEENGLYLINNLIFY